MQMRSTWERKHKSSGTIGFFVFSFGIGLYLFDHLFYLFRFLNVSYIATGFLYLFHIRRGVSGICKTFIFCYFQCESKTEFKMQCHRGKKWIKCLRISFAGQRMSSTVATTSESCCKISNSVKSIYLLFFSLAEIWSIFPYVTQVIDAYDLCYSICYWLLDYNEKKRNHNNNR